jgi:hypothetical protein
MCLINFGFEVKLPFDPLRLGYARKKEEEVEENIMVSEEDEEKGKRLEKIK